MGDGRWWNEEFQVPSDIDGGFIVGAWTSAQLAYMHFMSQLDLYLDRWEKNVSKITSSNLNNVSGASQTWPRGLSPETVPYDLGQSWLSWLQYETITVWLDLGTKLLLALWKSEFFSPIDWAKITYFLNVIVVVMVTARSNINCQFPIGNEHSTPMRYFNDLLTHPPTTSST